jgi:hypothetical protein
VSGMQTVTTEYLTPELEQLITLAAEVLNEHSNDHGLCAICGCAFPCERAVLAEYNLAL